MKNKFLLFSIASIFIIIFIVFYRGLQNTNIYTPQTKLQKEIPSFTIELLFSKKIANSSEIFKSNKFYLLNIWSSWCVPCRQEHSLLIDLVKNKKIEIIGINYKDTKMNAQNFLDELGNPYKKIFFDKDGTVAIEWGAFGVPESFLINNNRVIKRYIGPLNNDLIKEIKTIIK
jgi:cytochrome c biogenesis protein CcmG, thiol:disulfide interchange protein DsbE